MAKVTRSIVNEDASRSPRAQPLAPQVVLLKLPDGSTEMRLVSFDASVGLLRLRQVDCTDGGGEPSLGAEASIKLASIGDGAVVDGDVLALYAGGAGGRRLLELCFDSGDKSLAWAEYIKSAGRSDCEGYSGDRGSAGTGAASGATTASAAVYRKLVAQQEEQARLLETLNARKADQLFVLQGQFGKSLEELETAQSSYSRHNRLVSQLQRQIEMMTDRLRAATAAEAACMRNADEASAGLLAAAAARRHAAAS